ncbi:MAG: hypothetical protein ACFFDS_03685 [Candidatus Thorarchaeota archaeon]
MVDYFEKKSRKRVEFDEIKRNVIESEYVDVFISFHDDSSYFMYMAYTDFDQQIMSYEDFIDLIYGEIDYLVSERQNPDLKNEVFDFFYLEDENLIPFTSKNYLEVIEKMNIVIFATQNKTNAISLFKRILETMG